MNGTSIPTVVTKSGLQPQAVADLRLQLIAIATGLRPGLTTNLPGSLIEDILSTSVASISLMDQARVDLVNSLTPYGANEFLLNQLGQIYGVDRQAAANTSVSLVFSGTPGALIAKGFVVSDGTHQYIVLDGGLVGGSGTSPALFAVATTSGSWPVPANTVQQFVTSVPSSVTLTVTNPLAGVSGTADQQSIIEYRAAVLLAGKVSSMGTGSILKTALGKVSGVQTRLVSVRQALDSKWEIIVGGGDPYQVAYAIYNSTFAIENLEGSTIRVTGITLAVAGVVTTDLNHGYVTGQTVTITGVVGTTGVNGVPYTVTVTGPKTFTVGNTSGFGVYVSGGVCSPNARNVTVNIIDAPDSYAIPFVVPPQQSVAINATWNTTSTNFVSPAAVSQLAIPALVDYVNTLFVGTPINVFELQAVFQSAVAMLLPGPLLTRLIFSVSIDGLTVAPLTGTGIVAGDPESYFLTTAAQITVTQG